MTAAVDLAQYGTTSPSWRNRIINGGMTIDQRNAGASVTPTGSAYTLDRWQLQATQASKLSVQQITNQSAGAAGFPNYMRIGTASAYSVLAGDFFAMVQKIEAFNVSDLGFGTANAQAVTLSFRVNSTLSGTFGGSITNSNGTRSYPFTYSVPTTNTWTTINITIPGDTTGTWSVASNSVGMILYFGLGVGTTYSGTAGAWAGANYVSATGAASVVGTSGATFYITGVQLEKGSTATPFDYRGIGQELSLCQRYYEKSFPLATKPIQNSGAANGALIASGWSTTAFTILASTSFSVTKRAIPSTITTYNPFAVGSGWSRSGSSNFAVGDYATGENSIGLRVNESIVSSGNMSIHWSVEAEL
jgi:hypothetical protein